MQAALVRYRRRRARADGGSRPGDCVGKVGVSEANRDGFEGERPSPWNLKLRHNGFLERTKTAMEGSIRKRAGAAGDAEVLERGGDGVHRRERGRIPRGHRLRRGLHGIQGALADFPSCPKSRGLRGVRMFTGDKAAGMVGSIAEVFPGAKYQRRTVHFYRNALAKVPRSKRSQVAAMLKAIHAMESREAASAKAGSVATELDPIRLKEAAKVVRDGYAETLTYCEMPREHWRRIRTNNAIERLNREIRPGPA